MQIYTKYRLFILVSFSLVLFLGAHANASFENQIIDIRSCSGNDIGETNIQINTDNNKIYLELVREELDGFLPILNTTKKTIESKKITFEEFASTENMSPIDEEEKSALIGFKYWYISLVINPTEKSSVITVELLRPDDFNDRKHVDNFAKDFNLNYFSPDVYFSECKIVQSYISSNNQTNSEFFGIGIEIDTNDNEYPIVKNVLPNTPASRAGLQKQDKLWAIDGNDLFNKKHNEVVKLIQKTSYIQIFYFDKSKGASNRVSIRPEYITDPKIEEKERARKKAEEQARKKAEEQARKKAEEQAKKENEYEAKLQEKNKKIINLEQEITRLNTELKQLKEENSKLDKTITEYQNQIDENEQQLANTGGSYKILINIIFSLILISLIIIGYFTIKRRSIFGKTIFSKSGDTDISNKIHNHEAQETIKVSEKKDLDKTSELKQDLSKSSIITKSKQISADEIQIKVTDEDERNESRSIDTYQTSIEEEKGPEKSKVIREDEKIETKENVEIKESSNFHENDQDDLVAFDFEMQTFLKYYHESLTNPNSVAKFEKDYGIFGLDRSSPVTQIDNIEFTKSKLSLIKAQFWASDKLKNQLVILPARSLIVRSSELLVDSGRFGYKILNGVYRLKKSEKNRVVSVCNYKYIDNKIIVSEEGDLELKT